MPEIKTGIPYGANTFALEALNEKFNGKAKAVKLSAGKMPEKLTTLAEYQHLIQLSKIPNNRLLLSIALTPSLISMAMKTYALAPVIIIFLQIVTSQNNCFHPMSLRPYLAIKSKASN